MPTKPRGGTGSSRRFMTALVPSVTGTTNERRLRSILGKNSGRSHGQISVRHKGGRHKRFYRRIDFARDKRDISAKVVSVEYDPNRTANIALVHYKDGEKRYILAPDGLEMNQEIIAGEKAPVRSGNALPLQNIPIGTPVHNIELVPGKGGQMVRSAGTAAMVAAKENEFAHVKLPSGEVRKIRLVCYATVGQLSNIDWKNVVFGSAGRMRHRGIRPSVRGVAMSPRHHPHGGGEGRSGIGMKSPKSPTGKKTLGKKTRKKIHRTDRFIVQRRKK